MERKSLLSFLMAAVFVCTQSSAFAIGGNQDVGAGTVSVNDASTLYDDFGVNFDDTNGRLNWYANGVNIGNSGGSAITVAGDNFGYLDVIVGAGGAMDITGTIGSGTNDDLGLMNIESGHVTLRGNSWIENFMFMGADTELTVGGNKTLTVNNGGVRTSADGQGVLNLDPQATVNGGAGEVGAALESVNFDIASGGGTSTFNGNIYAQTVNVVAAGSGSVDVALNGNVNGNFNFMASGNNTVTLADTKNLNGTIATDNDGIGVFAFDGSSTVSGQIGTDSNKLQAVFAGADGKSVTFEDDVYVDRMEVYGTGYVNLQGDFNGDIAFTQDGNVYVREGNTVTGNVTADVDNTGLLYFNLNANIDGAVGTSGSKLRALSFSSGMGGNGTVNVSNDLYAHDINIYSGTTFNVLADIAMGGNVSISSYAPTQVSIFDIAANTVAVGGNLTFDDDAVFNVDILGDANYGSITVAGAATVPAEVAVDVTTSGNYISDGATFKVIDGAAGAGVAGGNTVTDDNNFVTFTATHLNNQDLILTASRSGSASYVPYAESDNTSNVATVLDTMAGEDSDFDTVLSVIDTLDTNNGEFDNALDQLGEDVSAGTKNTVVIAHNDSIKIVSGRMSSMRSAGLNGVAAGDVAAELEAWGQIFGSYQDQGTRDGVKGYDAAVYGCVIGADRALTDSIRAGLSLSYADSVVDFKKANIGDTDIESYQVSLYASYQEEDKPWYLSSMLSYGLNDYQGYRTINFGAINRRANADYDGQQYSVNVSGGYEFDINKFFVSPVASLQYMRLEVDGYTETGADSLNLIVDSKEYDFLDFEIGAQVKYPVYLADSDLTLIPAFYTMYAYEFNGDKEVVNSRFTGGGAAFRTEGNKPAKSSLRYGASLAMVFSDSISLDLSYGGKTKDEYVEHNASATVRMKF